MMEQIGAIIALGIGFSGADIVRIRRPIQFDQGMLVGQFLTGHLRFKVIQRVFLGSHHFGDPLGIVKCCRGVVHRNQGAAVNLVEMGEGKRARPGLKKMWINIHR